MSIIKQGHTVSSHYQADTFLLFIPWQQSPSLRSIAHAQVVVGVLTMVAGGYLRYTAAGRHSTPLQQAFERIRANSQVVLSVETIL